MGYFNILSVIFAETHLKALAENTTFPSLSRYVEAIHMTNHIKELSCPIASWNPNLAYCSVQDFVVNNYYRSVLFT